VGDARVGDPGDHINLDVVGPRQSRAAAVADLFDVDALIAARRIAVIDPEKRADLHLVAGLHQGLIAVAADEDDLARSEIGGSLKAEVGKGAALDGDGGGVGAAADEDRGAPEPVAGGIDPRRSQDQDRAGAFDHLLCLTDARGIGLFLIDE